MSDQAHKPLPKIRTFALDQAHARGEVFEPTIKSTPAAVTTIPTPAADTPQTRPVIQETPIVVKEKPVPQPPAFHELLKSQPTKTAPIVAQKPARAAVTVRAPVKPTPPKPAVKNIHATDAIVISSGKKTEFSLFKAIKESFAAWWEERTKAKPAPTFTVRDVHNRKQVIEKATTKTGAAVVTSPATLKETIAKRREETETVIKHDISWSPHTEPGYPLLPEHPLGVSTPIVTYKQKSSPTKEAVQEKTEPVRRFVPPSEDEVASGFGKEPEVPRFVPPPPPVAPPPSPTPPPPIPPVTIEEPLPPPISEPVTISIPKKPNPSSSYLKNGLRTLVRFDTTVTTVLVAGTVVSFVLMFFIVKTIITMISPELPTTEIATSDREPLLKTAIVSDIALSELSKSGFIQSFRSATRPSEGVVEYQATTPQGDALLPSALWNIFGFKTNPNFMQAVEVLRVGYVNGQLVLVMEVSDPTTAFGSLLLWEETMYEELSAMFGLPVTSVQNVRDVTIGSSDIRILEGTDGRELAAYGFFGNDIVIISTTVQTFATLTQ